MEISINERINSSLYSDVINSYVDINSITAQRNIVPGSYKETITQCVDQTLSTLNASGGQTLFTRLLLSPTVRNATLVQLAQVYFQYVIRANTLSFLLSKQDLTAGDTTKEDTATNNFKNKTLKEHLRAKFFYDTGFSISSMVSLCLVADAKVSTENFNYQQSLLTLNSLPDFATKDSRSETTLSALVENDNYGGVGSGLIDIPIVVGNTDTHAIKLNQDVEISGVIDLNKGNPLFHNFPIITRNIGQLYIKFYMENFLRELKIVYLNKSRVNVKHTITIPKDTEINATYTAGPPNKFKFDTDFNVDTVPNPAGVEYLPYQRLPVDKADFIYLDGDLYKVRCVITPSDITSSISFNGPAPIFAHAFSSNELIWQRFEIKHVEFDIEDYDDIKASQGKAGVYKFPVHMWRSKNFDQTNAASSSANQLQTTLNAPNIDRMFITQPLNPNYYTFLPIPPVIDMNPQLHNNPVLSRTEDTLNNQTVERIGSVFVDTDKHSLPSDLYNSLMMPTLNKQLFKKDNSTYGGKAAFTDLQWGQDTVATNLTDIHNTNEIFVPNKYAYAVELNVGGCFRRGYNSVIDGHYSPTVPINLQQTIIRDDTGDVYYPRTTAAENSIVNNINDFCGNVAYGNMPYSTAVASVHCLCDYIFYFNFDPYGNMVDFGISEYNGQGM